MLGAWDPGKNAEPKETLTAKNSWRSPLHTHK